MWELWLTIAVAVAVLVVTSVSLLIKKKQAFPNSPIFALAIALAVVGITFSDNPLVGYSFLGISIALSVIYAIRNSRKK
jgi:hypothetical protein